MGFLRLVEAKTFIYEGQSFTLHTIRFQSNAHTEVPSDSIKDILADIFSKSLELGIIPI